MTTTPRPPDPVTQAATDALADWDATTQRGTWGFRPWPDERTTTVARVVLDATPQAAGIWMVAVLRCMLWGAIGTALGIVPAMILLAAGFGSPYLTATDLPLFCGAIGAAIQAWLRRDQLWAIVQAVKDDSAGNQGPAETGE